MVFAVGCFLPPNEHEGRLKLYVGSELPRKLPVPVHFIDSGSEARSAKLATRDLPGLRNIGELADLFKSQVTCRVGCW